MLKLTSSEIKIKLIFSKIKLEVDFQKTGSLSLLVVVVDCSERHNSRPAGCELLASSASKASDPDDEDGLLDICQRIRIRMA